MPRASSAAEVIDLGHGFHEIVLHYGFMEDPDVPRRWPTGSR